MFFGGTYLEEILAISNLRTLQRQLLNALDNFTLIASVLGNEDLSRDVVLEEFGVDGVEDGGDERGDKGSGC